MARVEIGTAAFDEIRSHGERDYPHEACGLLLGRVQGDAYAVDESVPVQNLNTERARDRYDLDPRGHLEADRRARATGRDVVGVYHSHPDHPARPSETDRERAYAGWVYVIVQVREGRAADLGAFLLPEEGGAFATLEVCRS